MFIPNSVPPVPPRRPLKSNMRRVHGVSSDSDAEYGTSQERHRSYSDGERSSTNPTHTREKLERSLADKASHRLQEALFDWMPSMATLVRGEDEAHLDAQTQSDDESGSAPDALRRLRDEVEAVSLRVGVPSSNDAERLARVLDPRLVARVDDALVERMEALADRHEDSGSDLSPKAAPEAVMFRRLRAVALATELLETVRMRDALLAEMAPASTAGGTPQEPTQRQSARCGYGDALRHVATDHLVDRLM